MMKKKNVDNHNVKNKRFLITINVVGSSGPLRFVVNDDHKVSDVIDLALKMYARGGRLPALGFDFNKFLLYPSNERSEAMKANEAVGLLGERTFVLCKKQGHHQMTEARSAMITRHGQRCGWKSCFKILSH